MLLYVAEYKKLKRDRSVQGFSSFGVMLGKICIFSCSCGEDNELHTARTYQVADNVHVYVVTNQKLRVKIKSLEKTCHFFLFAAEKLSCVRTAVRAELSVFTSLETAVQYAGILGGDLAYSPVDSNAFTSECETNDGVKK